MHIYLSIDDTDNLDSPGSGQLAEMLAGELRRLDLATHCTPISRHQLFVHEAVPYTSHNSSMCFSAVIGESCLDELIRFSGQFLRETAAPGSDPGLCVAADDGSLDRKLLTAFGYRAKQSLLSKEEAYRLAVRTGVHLSEHGGTGDGVIGALAGIGLRMHGSDGRFRGWLNLGECGDITCSESLCAHPAVDGVVDDQGRRVPAREPILLAGSRIKTILCHHRQVIPVTATGASDGPAWTTLTKSGVKRF